MTPDLFPDVPLSASISPLGRKSMPTYRLAAMVTVSAYTIVEAESMEKALEMGAEREAVIGDERFGNDARSEWIICEADGEPQNIRIEWSNHER